MEEHAEKVEAAEIPTRKRLIPFIRIERVIAAIETALNYGSVVFILFLMFFAAAEVVGRYVFNAPIRGHMEIVELIMAAVVFLGMAYTQRVGGHVRMEIFITGVIKGRYRDIAECITLLVSLAIYGVIAYYTLQNTMYSREIGDVTSFIKWPTWQSKLCISIGSMLLCVRFIIEFIQHLRRSVVRGEMRVVE